jgi:opacity protein-like surface antigen
MKNLLVIAILFFSIHSQSQTYVKINALTTAFTVPNVGIETSIGEKFTFQFDILASPWKSINGKPREFYSFIPEVRYHFNEKHNGFYVGGHIGGSIFNFQKWNYLNTDLYEKGYGYVMGATIGYQTKINDKFALDCFLGGGSSQSFYKGYYISTGERYDKATNYNKSGEWIPYRGGVMISYRIN